MKPLPAILVLLVTASQALACAGCREPGADVESSTVMAGIGFSWGVLFMLAFVFSLCGGLGAYVVKTVRALDRKP